MSSDKKIQLDASCKITFESPDDGFSYFFGYYDKSPVNSDGSKLLCHRVGFDGRAVQSGDAAEVGYFDLNSDECKFISLESTLAWNWQQGSQLQWLGPDYSSLCIFNAVDKGRYVAVILDVDTLLRKVINFPVYAVHPNGKTALGVRYERHYWCRPGYNYQSFADRRFDENCADDDGIFLIDLEKNQFSLKIPVPQLASFPGCQDTSKYQNWVEHILYSPSGKAFMFFLRWLENGEDKSRVFIVDNDWNLSVLPDNKFFSHYCWKGEQILTIWTSLKSRQGIIKQMRTFLAKLKILKELLMPAYNLLKKHSNKSVINLLTQSSSLVDYQVLCPKEVQAIYDVQGNGHQTWFKDQQRLLNDTYQDEESYRELMVVDTDKKITKSIGKFFSTYNDCTYRCDLHPRLSFDEKKIVIDSAHNLTRKILVIEGFG